MLRYRQEERLHECFYPSVTAILIDANDDKGATILRSRFRRDESLQPIDSLVELRELLAVVMRAKAILDANSMLVIVATVPDHFLEEHLWKHVVRGHVPRIFLWTFGSLLVLHLVVDRWQFDDVIRDSKWLVLVLASLLGLIPESGPHLIFVTMFAKGVVPLSVLLASSIVQDGHGMLPMLAHSRRAFIVIKLINLAVGLARDHHLPDFALDLARNLATVIGDRLLPAAGSQDSVLEEVNVRQLVFGQVRGGAEQRTGEDTQ
jgi:hypothetical protein